MSSTAQNIKRWMYMYYVSKINKQSMHIQKKHIIMMSELEIF